jgi:hypothetical protein
MEKKMRVAVLLVVLLGIPALGLGYYEACKLYVFLGHAAELGQMELSKVALTQGW